MKYRMIITYNFSEDETRSTFEKLVEELGFVEAEDQSTYVLPYVIKKVSKDVVDPIVKWSEDKGDMNLSPVTCEKLRIALWYSRKLK